MGAVQFAHQDQLLEMARVFRCYAPHLSRQDDPDAAELEAFGHALAAAHGWQLRQDAEQREHAARAALSARENAALLGVHQRVRAHREGRRLSGDAVTPAELRRLASLAPEGDLRERLLRDAEVREHACEDCQGTGVQVVHVCEDNRECARKCPQVETCMGCLGTGRQPR